jgi:hypothetical protein
VIDGKARLVQALHQEGSDFVVVLYDENTHISAAIHLHSESENAKPPRSDAL